MTLITSQ